MVAIHFLSYMAIIFFGVSVLAERVFTKFNAKVSFQEEYSGISLIENPLYDTCNNISSLYYARNHIENAMILDGDQLIFNHHI